MWIPKAKPDFVYKYCSAPRAAQIINDLTFFFAPAASLNDLFEFRPRSLYREDDDSKYKVFAKRLIAEGWFSDFDEAFTAAKAIDNDSVDQTYASFLEQLHARFTATMAGSGVTCFSSERNNQRMWGTYGVNHTGAVIEFAADKARATFAPHLMPVIYTDVKPPICPSELLTEQMALDQWMLGVFFCIKHIHWKDECEWRLLLLADSPQRTHDRIVPFERSSITRVFIGPRIAEEQERAIRLAASRHDPEIPVFKREVEDELATEQMVGFEQIHSLDQLEYWSRHTKRRAG